MTLLRRLIAWLFYFGFLSAVGVSVFMFVRYRPRCTIVESSIGTMHLSGDGSRLVTLKQSKTKARHGPLRVWDTQTGEIVHEMLGDVEVGFCRLSADDQHCAVNLPDGTLRLIDWRTGQEWPFEVPNGVEHFRMSPKGRWLLVAGAVPRGDVIVDLNTRQISLRLDEQFLRFSADDRWAFARQGEKTPIDVWDLAAAKKIATIAADGSMLPSPDGASLVTWWSEDKTARGARLRALEFWDLPSGRKRCRFEFSAPSFSPAFFSPNSRFLAMRIEQEKGEKVVLLDAETGQKLWEAMAALSSGDFSPDSALYLSWHGDEGQTFTMYDVATGRKLWERDAGPSITRFAGDSGNLFLQELDGKKPLLFLDARTGAAKTTGPQSFRTAYFFPFSTHDAKSFVIDGWQMRNREAHFWETWLEKRWPKLFGDDSRVAVVVESASGRELFRINRQSSLDSMLSTDTSTLVTLDDTNSDDTVIRVWHVHPHRAWTWALSSVAATMLVCFCYSRLLRALRNRKKTIAAANC